MIVNWIRKWMGYHVCEEFTRWTTVVRDYTRPASIERDGLLAARVKTIEWQERYQERECTICGQIQQRKIEYL